MVSEVFLNFSSFWLRYLFKSCQMPSSERVFFLFKCPLYWRPVYFGTQHSFVCQKFAYFLGAHCHRLHGRIVRSK
jgi:hypothetical protein